MTSAAPHRAVRLGVCIFYMYDVPRAVVFQPTYETATYVLVLSLNVIPTNRPIREPNLKPKFKTYPSKDNPRLISTICGNWPLLNKRDSFVIAIILIKAEFDS